MKFYAKKTIPLFIAILAVCLLSAGAALCAAETPVVYTSLPWLSGMARFIVGATMKVQSSSSWSSSGELRVPRKPPKNATVIALDPLDASRLGLSREADGLHLLYDNLPIENSARGSLHFNPSVLPFLSQRMLKVLCELSPDNYSFYQRRLAEFQSRLESAVEVGRSQIRDIPILDLTGAVSPWLKAASGKVARPPDELWNAWAQSARTSDLAIAVKEAETRGWLILTDVWTPSQIKSRVASSGKRLAISPPAADYDFFAYLHDIYLQIWTLNSEK